MAWVDQRFAETARTRSGRDITVGPLLCRMEASEWMPIVRVVPRRRAWRRTPAWPVRVGWGGVSEIVVWSAAIGDGVRKR